MARAPAPIDLARMKLAPKPVAIGGAWKPGRRALARDLEDQTGGLVEGSHRGRPRGTQAHHAPDRQGPERHGP